MPAGARFCPSCGNPVDRPPFALEERRVVTVLFADLVGYTSLAEYLDPERVKRLIEACFERLVADIEQFGGRVDKLLGDAIVALFGAPVAHEDDAERAVRAALRMQSTLARFVDDVGADPPIQMRIGINTGEVLVGTLAGSDYTAMGDVVNTAARLQSLAPTGGVLIGSATAALCSAIDPPRAVRRHPHPWPRAARAVVARHRRVGCRQPPGPLRRAVRRPRATSGPCSTPPCSSSATVAAASSRSSVRPAPARPGWPTSSSSALEDEAIVIRTACAPYGETNPLAPVVDGLSALLGLDPEATAAGHRGRRPRRARSSCGASTPTTRSCAGTSTR